MSLTKNSFLKSIGYISVKLKFLKTNHYLLKACINGVEGKFILDLVLKYLFPSNLERFERVLPRGVIFVLILLSDQRPMVYRYTEQLPVIISHRSFYQ